jgi:ADP-ribose pyrophosphatase YjhB (NUDIX family)
MDKPSLAQQLALWADKLRDDSAMGLRFARNIYDQHHYQSVQRVALEMLALTTGAVPEALEPLRATVLSHPTPFTTGDGAVIDAAGRMLLIQRADTQQWAMPGGALEVGETPAEGIIREVLEETGIACRATALVGVFDSRRCGSITPHHLYHFLFLCEPLPLPRLENPSHANEVLRTQWFAEADIPADLYPGHALRMAEAWRVYRGDAQPFFDGGR